MPSLDKCISFAEKYISDKEGRPFTLAGRPWVIDEYWRPMTGFKLWPHDTTKLCDDCRERAGTIADYTTATPDHTALGCLGLYLSPILITVLNLKRRSGKTFNTAAFALSTLCQSKNESITYVASSEDQAAQLFDENYRRPIENSKKLTKACNVVGNTITVASTRSFFEHVSTSHGSITGRGRTAVIIDEARDVSARVAMALIPSVFDHYGVECPHGHVHAHLHKSEEPPVSCSVCGALLTPWYGRILIMSSSGLIEGNEKDWFGELVTHLSTSPHPNYHLYSTNATINPNVSETITTAVSEVFGQLEATREYTDIELNNNPRRKGEDFVSAIEYDRCVDKRVGNTEGSTAKCVAFLDTSTSVEKTSLVILADDTPPTPAEMAVYGPWSRLVTLRIDIWEPAKLPHGLIDENAILAHLDRYMPLFPLLDGLYVDTRVMPWAQRLVKHCRAQRPWGKRVHAFNGNTEERNTAWKVLEQHLLAGTIRLPHDKELKAEIMAVRRVKNLNGITEIRDRKRRVRHADIAEGLAECCRQAFLRALNKQQTLEQLSKRSSKLASILQTTYRPIAASIKESDF